MLPVAVVTTAPVSSFIAFDNSSMLVFTVVSKLLTDLLTLSDKVVPMVSVVALTLSAISLENSNEISLVLTANCSILLASAASAALIAFSFSVFLSKPNIPRNSCLACSAIFCCTKLPSSLPKSWIPAFQLFCPDIICP